MIRFRSCGGRLLRQEGVEQEVEPATDRAVGRLARRLDRGETVGVGKEVGEGGLELHAAALVLVVREDVQLPPCVRDAGVERGELALDLIGDGARVHRR